MCLPERLSARDVLSARVFDTGITMAFQRWSTGRGRRNQRKARSAMRPRLRPRDIVRVELRLPQRAAEVLYWCAQDWNVSLSTAGAKLIELGYEHAARREAV